MNTNTSQRFPDPSKLSLAILEHLVEPVIGEKAIEEIHRPQAENELRESLHLTFSRAETRFRAEHMDKELCEALLNLPLNDLPTMADAVRDYYELPIDTSLMDVLHDRFVADYPDLESERVVAATRGFLKVLKEELTASDSEIGEKLAHIATIRMADTMEQISNQLANQSDITPEDLAQVANEYRNFMIAELKDHTIRGFAPQVGGRVISLPLADVFLPLEAIEGRPALAEYAEADLLRQAAGKVMDELDWQRQREEMEKRYAQLSARQAAQRSLNLEELLKSSRSVLLGDPGTGKTTVTRYISYALAAEDMTHLGRNAQGLIPVLIRIANYAKALEADSTLHVIEYVERELTPRPEFGTFLRRAIENAKCLIILDGLDEVTNTGLRIRVTERIQTMVASFHDSRFLVTSSRYAAG